MGTFKHFVPILANSTKWSNGCYDHSLMSIWKGNGSEADGLKYIASIRATIFGQRHFHTLQPGLTPTGK